MHDPQPLTSIPTFTPNASDHYGEFFNAVVACCQKHPDVFTFVVHYAGDNACGLGVYLNDGAYTADSYAAFIAALRWLPDTLPDGDLALNLFAPKGQPVLKLWHD